MANKKIHLRLINDFNCTGSACPASCCSGWQITVDKDTHEKWQGVAIVHPKLGLLESLIEKKTTQELCLKNKDNSCTHLSADGLCNIQLTLGHDYLPQICQSYPRVFWSTDSRDIASLKLSCPEVVRLLLKENNESLFVMSKAGKRTNGEHHALTLPIELASLLEDYVSQVMQNKKYPINILLLTIAKKLIDIASLSQQGLLNLPDLQKKLKGVAQQLKQINNDVNEKRISSSAENTGRFWHLVYMMGHTADPLLNTLNEFDDVLFEKLASDDESEKYFEDIGWNIKTYRENFNANVPAFYKDFMRRYLRVKFLNNGFPWSPVEGNLIAGLLYCVLPYAYIQLFVWVTYNNKKVVTEQDVAEIVYKVERKLDHNDKIYRFLSEHPALLRLDTYYTCLADV